MTFIFEKNKIKNLHRYPDYRNTHSLKVTLRAGDILYLPLLYSIIRQFPVRISINYWYDMEFNIKYIYFKALETSCK